MWQRLRVPGFLKSFLFVYWCVCVCVCVCVSTPKTVNILCDIDRVWLVKPILKLFSLLLSVNWMGVALVAQHIMHTRPRYRNCCHASHGRRHINHLAVATRQSALVIRKGECSNKFKTRPGFSFTVIVLA